MLATYLRPERPGAEGRALRWPVATIGGERVPLDRIAPADGVTAAKLYAGPLPAAAARVCGRCCVELSSTAPYVGLYINLGGWPQAGSGLHQLGIEPTIAAADDLTRAIGAAQDRVAGPGDREVWEVCVRIDGDGGPAVAGPPGLLG